MEKIEEQMANLGNALPPRPPKEINTPGNTEVLRNELMYRIVLLGIQNFVSEHVRSILSVQNSQLRDMFMEMGKAELDYYAKFTAYGKLKGWLCVPPEYRTTQG